MDFVEKLSEGHAEVEHEPASVLPRHDRTASEIALDDYMEIVRRGQLELIRFAATSANILTQLAVEASKTPDVCVAMSDALAIHPEGFLALCHRLDSTPSEFFELLAAFRAKREAAANPIAGTPSPP